MNLLFVGGTRPNFIKISPLVRACGAFEAPYKIVHTGQHYDFNMSEIFFKQLDIRVPDYNLEVGSSSHADQVAKIMQSFEKVCINEKPDIVVVVGDVNSTLACSLVVSKMPDIKLAHVEAGLRCLDRNKPEEVNRVVSDVLSDYLFATTDYAVENLLKEAVAQEKIFLVGDVVLDNLIYNLSNIEKINCKDYVLVTIHRPLSTDNKDNLETVLKALSEISKKIDVRFPIHPRTLKKIMEFKLEKYLIDLLVMEPVGYLDFLSLLVNSKAVITDSGGVQVETTFLGLPCISIMTSTSHLYTLKKGTNELVGYVAQDICAQFEKSLESRFVPHRDVLADGRASERILKILIGEGNV